MVPPLDILGHPWYHLWYIPNMLGESMFKDIHELIDKLSNLTRRLEHLDKKGMIDTLHLVELFCELSDIVLGFDIEHYQEDSDDSSWEDSSTEENKKPT